MKPLLLAGGKSTRMGTPKHLLRMPDGTPLYQRQLQLLRAVFPEPQTIYISLAQESETDEFLSALLSSQSDESIGNSVLKTESKVQILRDEHPNDSKYSAGPAAGLLAAYRFDRWANWVVIACDYPLLPPDALYQMFIKRDAVPVTCYRSAEGACDPLLAIWAPAALSRLSERVARGHSSLTAAAKELDALMLDTLPGCEWWLTNVNTMEEWLKAVKDMKIEPPEPVLVEAPKGTAECN